MSDVGPEDPLCLCGSGLKHRRCHGSIVDPVKAAGNLPLNATAFRTGLAGLHTDPASAILVGSCWSIR